jgi:PleD family two-component response regulator
VAGDTSSALLSRADEAMYYAKNAGRNRAVLWDDDTFKMITNP